MDAVGIDRTSNARVLLNNGTGTLSQGQTLTAGINPGFGVATADLNSDGKLDLVITSSGAAVYYRICTHFLYMFSNAQCLDQPFSAYT